MSETSVNRPWKNAWQLLKHTDHSVFLTGKAGTGKSTFLTEFCKQTDKAHIVLAPTGIAAINVRGMTVHSFFQLPLGPILPYDDRIKKIRYRKNKQEIMKKLELLVIDEISMVRADMLDAIDRVLRKVRKSPLPFGGVQLLLVGDLFQLEPVVKDEHRSYLETYYRSPFFFDALVFQELDLICVQLEKIYRQQDERFISFLNAIREGNADEYILEALNASTGTFSPDIHRMRLTTTRKAADQINSQKLKELKEPVTLFEGKIEKEFPEDRLPTDKALSLKRGAQVMFIRNDLTEEKRWVNGTIGTVEYVEKELIRIKLEDGTIHNVEQESWENIKYDFDKEKARIKEEVMGTFTQFPIKLAWAITIHKSQGLTFERVEIDLGYRMFAAGQLYVALSRCTSLDGLRLNRPIKYQDVLVRQEVIDFSGNINDDYRIKQVLSTVAAK